MRRVLLSAILVGAGLAAGLGIAEIMVRVFAPHSRDHVVPAGMFAIDPALGWRLSAGTVSRHRTRYFDATYTINSLGFRDRPRLADKPDSVTRVLAFGDSQVFGWGVSDRQRFSSVMETLAPRLEAWNMGVPGYGFDQQVLSYERSGQGIRADAVIFYASAGTLSRMNVGFLYRKPKPKFIIDSTGALQLFPPATRSAAVTDAVYRLLSPFYLPYFLEVHLVRLAKRDARAAANAARAGLDSATIGLFEAVLLRARAAAVARGHRLILLVSLPDETVARLQAFSDANGITLVSTGWESAPSNLVFGKHDVHWVPEAHAQVAAKLMPALVTVATDPRDGS